MLMMKMMNDADLAHAVETAHFALFFNQVKIMTMIMMTMVAMTITKQTVQTAHYCAVV